MKHICEICKKEFETKGKKPRRVCSKQCYSVLLSQIHANKVKTKVCKVCGKEFKPVKLKCGRYSEATTCSKECALKLSEESCIQKFGVKNASQSDQIKNKKEQTCLKNHGVKYPGQSKEVLEKAKQTNLEKYGTEFAAQSEITKEKMKQTNLKKYGCVAPLQNPEIRKKVEETNLQKYGTKTPAQNKEVAAKMKQVIFDKYNVENVSVLPEIKEKVKQTNLERYGADNFSKSKEYQERLPEISAKQYNTKKKNNSFAVSSEEELIYEKLSKKFSKVIRQHKSELYPFACDFYIPELDLYIEYQGTWTHGGEPFYGTEEQLKRVELWESKDTAFYRGAIETWTVRDPSKREIAKQNNLNWVEFFTLESFLKWYEEN